MVLWLYQDFQRESEWWHWNRKILLVGNSNVWTCRKLNVTENERYKQILMRTSKSRLRLETKFLIEHATSSTHGSIHLLIEKDFVWLMRQNIWLLIHSLPNLVWPLKKKMSFRAEWSRAKLIRWQGTALHLITTTLAPNVRTTQSGFT